MLNADSENFEKLAEETSKDFDAKPQVYKIYDFYSTQVRSSLKQVIMVTQGYKIKSLSFVANDASFEGFQRY